LHNLSEKKRKDKKMTTCYECGENIIYSNDAFDVISKCSNEDCETHKAEKKDLTPLCPFYIKKKENYLMIGNEWCRRLDRNARKGVLR
jgi:hypothetical protein